jgi:hypothetical protein
MLDPLVVKNKQAKGLNSIDSTVLSVGDHTDLANRERKINAWKPGRIGSGRPQPELSLCKLKGTQ